MEAWSMAEQEQAVVQDGFEQATEGFQKWYREEQPDWEHTKEKYKELVKDLLKAEFGQENVYKVDGRVKDVKEG